MKKIKNKLPIVLIIVGVCVIALGQFASLYSLFSIYGKVSSDGTCGADVKGCDTSTEEFLVKVGGILTYLGIALLIAALIIFVLKASRKKDDKPK